MWKRAREIFIWIAAVLAIGWIAKEAFAQERIPFVMQIKINHHNSIDLRGIEFFDLQNSKGSVLLSGDGDLALVQFLQQHDGEKLILSLEVVPGAK